MRIYVDANIVIAMFEAEGPLRERLRGLVEIAEQRTGLLVTSELTLAECLVAPLRILETPGADQAAAADLIAAYEEAIRPAAAIDMVSVDRRVLTDAALLRARFGSLKLPNALHLATALAAGCDTFLSADAKAAAIAGRIGLSPLLPTIETVDQLLRDAG